MVDRVDDKRRKMARLDDLADARRFDDGVSFADEVAVHVLDLGVESCDRRLTLLSADDRNLDLVADVDAAEKAKSLLAIECPRTGKDISEHRRDERADPHRGSNRLGLLRRALGRGQHQRIEVARHMREQDEVLHGASAFETGAVADIDLRPSFVSDCRFGAHVGLFNLKTHFSS